MRIYLINPPRIHPKSWGKPNVAQPIEIAYVASVLEAKHTVGILDAPAEGWDRLEDLDTKRLRVGLSKEDIAQRIKDWKPDVVGINVPFSGWSKAAFEVAALVKEVESNIITVMDGVHPSARPEDCLLNSNVDFVVIGEAENTWLELADALERGAPVSFFENIRGLGFKERERIRINPPRPLIMDLDSLPSPARHLLPMETYFKVVRKSPLRGEIFKPWTTIITSRGCPYHCIFCSAHLVRGRAWRGRTPENVVAEIEHVVKVYGVKQIDFHDDNLTFDRKRMEQICDLIVEKGLDIEWFTPNGVRADTLDENLLKKMKRAGCKRIYVAPESGVQRVVNQVINKKLDLRSVERAVALSRKVGIKVACFFIIGLPGETKEDIKATIKYAYKLRRLGADKFYFSYAMPLYGTKLYEMAVKMGYLSEEFSDDALSAVEPLIETSEFSKEDLIKLSIEANNVNPLITLDKLKSLIKNPRSALKFLYERVIH
jgi:magnesium-protoporphyrin IX monomethyl ester (oxidative) cyclase